MRTLASRRSSVLHHHASRGLSDTASATEIPDERSLMEVVNRCVSIRSVHAGASRFRVRPEADDDAANP